MRHPLPTLALVPIISILMTLAGCGSAVLVPTTLPTPLLHGAGEIEAAAHLGSNGIDVTASGAVADELIVSGLFSWNHHREGDEVLTRHLYGEGAVGYNVPFRRGSVICLLAGAGAGSSVDNHPFQPERTMDFTKTFVQILFGSRPIARARSRPGRLTFEGGVTVRGSRIDPGSTGAGTLPDGTLYFIEPRLFLRGIWGPVGCGTQFGMSLPLSGTDLEYSVFNGALALSVHFDVSPPPDISPLDP